MNKIFQVKYLPIAKKDLIDIFEYILSDNPTAASKWLDGIDSSISNLKDFPYIGVAPKDSRLKYLGYRILVIGNYPVFYVVISDEIVEIRRIIHGKRRYDFLL